MRRNQVRICSFKQHVKVCKKEATYKAAMKALCDGRDNNPTHKETFNKFISDLRRKMRNGVISQLTVNILTQGLSSRRKTMMDTKYNVNIDP